MKLPLFAQLGLLSVCSIFAVGCATHDTRLTDTGTSYLGADGTVRTLASARAQAADAYWDGDGVVGAPRIVIDLSEQTASFYKGGKLVGVSPVSTGREGYNTPTGNFKVIQKNKDHRSNLYGDYVDSMGNVVVSDVAVREDPKPAGTSFLGASMPYFMRVHGGVGMHAGFLPGVPDSHGCIRMPEHMAEIYFANASNGTPVTITN